jgi:membrane protease YdiL (CAAX protease family)
MDSYIPDRDGSNDIKTLPKLWNWRDILIISIAIALILVLGVVLLTIITQGGIPENPADAEFTLGYSAGLAAIEAIAILISVYMFGILRKRISWQSIGLRETSKRWMLAAVILALAIIPIVGLIATVVQLIFGLPLENPQLPFLAPGEFSWSSAFGMLVAGGVIVPIAEEIFFRGLLYHWLRQFWPVWASMIISSAVFGILHGDVAVAVATFFMGLLLAWFYEKSKSLWPSITIHILNNGIKLVLLYALLAAGIDINTLQ